MTSAQPSERRVTRYVLASHPRSQTALEQHRGFEQGSPEQSGANTVDRTGESGERDSTQPIQVLLARARLGHPQTTPQQRKPVPTTKRMGGRTRRKPGDHMRELTKAELEQLRREEEFAAGLAKARAVLAEAEAKVAARKAPAHPYGGEDG
jgi:hypothetical protein